MTATPTYTKLPQELDLEINRVDGIDIPLTSSINFTGYTFPCYIVPKDGSAQIAITVAAVTTLADGDLRLTCTPALLANLPYDVHEWYMDWVDASLSKRRAIVGKLTNYQYGKGNNGG